MSKNDESSSVTPGVIHDQSFDIGSGVTTYVYPPFTGFGWDFFRIFHLIIVIIGTVANVCLIVMLVKDKEKKTSATLYLGAMAANDIVMLVVYLVFYWLYMLIAFDFDSTSSVGCKITSTLNATTQTLSAWLVIVLIIERLIYFYFPRITKIFTRRMTGIFVTIMTMCVAFIFNTHFTWYEVESFRSQTDNTTKYRCVANRRRLFEYATLYETYIFSILSGLCPVVCILIGNVFFVKTLYRSFMTTEQNRHANIDLGRNRDLLVCTMMISILYLFVDVPRIFDNSFNLLFTDKFIFLTLWLIVRSIKLFVYILYYRGFRLHFIKKNAKAHGIASNP